MSIITYAQLCPASEQVYSELMVLGLWDEAIYDIDIFLTTYGSAYGYQFYGSTREIQIPRISLSRLADLWHRQTMCLKDVLRHEFGHAVADTHRGLIRSKKFREAFGATHNWDVVWNYDPQFHVTEYAATATAEDFAEVFMLYVQFGGKLPAHLRTPTIRQKWNFVRDLGWAISHGYRRWP